MDVANMGLADIRDALERLVDIRRSTGLSSDQARLYAALARQERLLLGLVPIP
jgi:hypothetical protein